MSLLPKPLDNLIGELQKLPGVGPKTALRLALHLLKTRANDAPLLAQAINDVVQHVGYCARCFNLAEGELCEICRVEPNRDLTLLCVVEEPHDVISIERMGEFRGLYHVLLGVISPLKGIGPEDLKIDELMERIEDGNFEEVILATNPNVEGEATAMYLYKMLKPKGLKLTRLAHGIPVGGHLEYADAMTLSRAFEGRREF